MDIEIEDNQIKRNTTERLIILTFVMTSWTRITISDILDEAFSLHWHVSEPDFAKILDWDSKNGFPHLMTGGLFIYTESWFLFRFPFDTEPANQLHSPVDKEFTSGEDI